MMQREPYIHGSQNAGHADVEDTPQLGILVLDDGACSRHCVGEI